MKKYFIIFIIGIVIAAAGYFLASYINRKDTQLVMGNKVQQVIPEDVPVEIQKNPEEKNEQSQESGKENVPQKIEQKVAFMAQAPFGNWKDPIFENGCEEAAMIMAYEWIKGTPIISAKEAQDKIKKLTAFEDKTLGYDTDTDINDIQIIFRDFFHYSNVDVRENITLPDIINEIQKGNIILVPTFGRVLNNPNYTPPGPVTHMLVIIGYDPDIKKFIANDSGTKHGRDYQYSENVLFDAIWEYPSGPKLPDPPKGILQKGMLVVEVK